MWRIRHTIIALAFLVGIGITHLSDAASSSIVFRNAPAFVYAGTPFDFFVRVKTQPNDVVLTVAVIDGDVPVMLSQVDVQQNPQPQHHFVWTMREPGDFYLVATIVNDKYRITATQAAELHILSRH